MKAFLNIFFMGSNYLWHRKLNISIFIGAPLLFILILGNALSAYISPDLDFEPIPVAFVTDNEASVFAEFLKSVEISRFLESNITEEEQAREMLSENAVHLVIFEQKGEISVLKPNIITTDASVALSIIESYKKTAAAAEIAIANGANPLEVMKKAGAEFSVEAKPIGKRVPTATDYYAVTMLVYIMLLAGVNGLDLFSKSLLSDTGMRIMASPVSKPALTGGLLAASTITSFLQGMVTFVFTALVYGVYWGERIPLVLLTLFIVVLFSQAVCLFLLLLFKNANPAMGFMQAFFWVTTFVSKGYAKISFGEADKFFAYSPNALAHTAIFGAIYGGNDSKIMFSLALLFAASAVFFAGAFLFGRRRLT